MLSRTNNPPKKPTSSEKQKAFSLIEAAIVLGVVGLVIGGIWVASSTVQEKMRINQAVNDMNLITNNLRTTFSNIRTPDSSELYNNVTTPTLNSSVFPANALLNSQPVTPWGLPYDASIRNWSGDDILMLRAWVPSVASCANLATALIAAFRLTPQTTSFIGIDGALSGSGYQPGDDYSPAAIIASCKQAADDQAGAEGSDSWLGVSVNLKR